ncbi:MAG TPA: potassium channel family protein [Gemmatimonadaceae bacterium]
MLQRLEQHLELPMAVLAVVWLALFIIEMIRGNSLLLMILSTAIWIIFVAEFLIRLLVAPDRWQFLKRSWLTIVALIVPALRVFRLASIVRAARAARAARGVRLIRAVGTLNRGMSALGATFRRTGILYVTGLIIAVCFAGAAGMYALEPHATDGSGFSSYADALWWTAMIITTLGSAYWPVTPEGRILAVLISLVAIGVFGYLTATLASFLVGRDAAATDGSTASGPDVRALQRDIAELRKEIREMMKQQSAGD